MSKGDDRPQLAKFEQPVSLFMFVGMNSFNKE